MADDTGTTVLSCDDVEALLPLVAEGAIEPEDDAELFAHLAECPDCQADLALHDLTTLALSHGRPQSPAAGEAASEVVRLPWPAVAGGLALAAGVILAVWLGRSAGDEAVSATEPPRTQVVEVRRDADGNEVIVLDRDGERIEIQRIDDDDHVGGDDAVSVPVGMPQRR